MGPQISVILLTYNHEKYIAQAIESVLRQKTNFEVELIVGEDSSTDKTREIVRSYYNNHPARIILELAEKNRGVIQNEKECMKRSSGKYIAFLEGDDYWTDDLKLQKQFGFLEAHPDYGLVHGDVNHYHEATGKTDHQVNRTKGIKIPEGAIFHELLKPDPLFIKTATACFRKELVEKHFDYDLAIKENWPLTDLPLWMDISYRSKVHYMDEVLATYRLLNESASRTALPGKKYAYHKALYAIKQAYMKKYLCEDRIKRELEEEYYRGLIKIAFNLDDPQLAQEGINFLKNKRLRISRKERVMLLATKNKFLKAAIDLIR